MTTPIKPLEGMYSPAADTPVITFSPEPISPVIRNKLFNTPPATRFDPWSVKVLHPTPTPPPSGFESPTDNKLSVPQLPSHLLDSSSELALS